jgi:hypothetical protein
VTDALVALLGAMVRKVVVGDWIQQVVYGTTLFTTSDLQVLISPTFYEQFFHSKVKLAAFLLAEKLSLKF